MEALINKRVSWLKQSREEECLKLQENANKDKAPIIAEYNLSNSSTSTRYRHFSVYDGNIHHYSRFKRVIVSYDTAENKWTCSCCRKKVNCVHKCVAKWFTYAQRPHDLLSNNTDSESDDEFPEDSRTPQNEAEYSVTGANYPPKQGVLKKWLNISTAAREYLLNSPERLRTTWKDIQQGLFQLKKNVSFVRTLS